MAVPLYELPMLECSSCGQHLGHLYEDYYRLTKQLMEELETQSVPYGDYTTSQGDDLTSFVQTYYTWLIEQDQTRSIPVHEPCNIIARALLRTRELKLEHLPFGSAKEDDGQMSVHEARICCLRMFQTDPKMTKLT